jgi:hypothetical protein
MRLVVFESRATACATCISSGDTEAMGVPWSETMEGSDIMLYEVLVEAKELRSYFEGIEKTLDVLDVRVDEAIDGRETCPGMCCSETLRICVENRLISGNMF